MVGRNEPFDADIPYAEAVARIAAHPLEWEPGTEAGYHPSSGWKILGAIVEQVDGRPIDRYLAEEVVGPAGMTDARLGIDREAQAALGDRLVPVHWTGHAFPVPTSEGGIRMWPYHMEEIHNEAWHIAKVEPGGGFRGPAVGPGPLLRVPAGISARRRILDDARTVEVMAAVHRYDVPDRFFGAMRTPVGPRGPGGRRDERQGGPAGLRAQRHGLVPGPVRPRPGPRRRARLQRPPRPAEERAADGRPSSTPSTRPWARRRRPSAGLPDPGCAYGALRLAAILSQGPLSHRPPK